MVNNQGFIPSHSRFYFMLFCHLTNGGTDSCLICVIKIKILFCPYGYVQRRCLPCWDKKTVNDPKREYVLL